MDRIGGDRRVLPIVTNGTLLTEEWNRASEDGWLIVRLASATVETKCAAEGFPILAASDGPEVDVTEHSMLAQEVIKSTLQGRQAA